MLFACVISAGSDSSVHTEVCIFWLCLCLQCWCWPDGDFLCIEYSSGAGESRRDPGCLPDSEEPQTAETPHGADTGKDLITLELELFIYYNAPLCSKFVFDEESLLSSH